MRVAKETNTIFRGLDYYAFGSEKPGRCFASGEYKYGFNDKLKDDELKGEGNSYDFGARMYDPRLGKFLSIDKFANKFPFQSPYSFADNSPISTIDANGDSSVVVVRGTSNATYTAPTGEIFVMYAVEVYENMTAAQYEVHNTNGTLPTPNYTSQLARDANDISSGGQTVVHSANRYGNKNETPPGTYFLFKPGTKGDAGGGSYQLYLGDQNGSRVINGPDGTIEGVAIHQYDPRDSQGCLTTGTGNNTQPISDLINAIPDLNDNTQPVQIILQPREVEELQYPNPANGPIKFKGVVTVPSAEPSPTSNNGN